MPSHIAGTQPATCAVAPKARAAFFINTGKFSKGIDNGDMSVISEVKKIINWFNSKRSLDFETDEDLVGGAAYDEHGTPITDEVFYKALEEQSFNTAESILKYLNVEFASENFQVLIFNLLADFRDEKYPEIANSNLIINVENPANCTLQLLQLGVSIPNGPGVNIASVELLSPNITRPIKLDKSNSTVRGFDIASAFMQQEIIKIEALAECDNFIFEAFKTIDLKYSQDNQEELFFYTDEWLKREQ